MPKVANPKRKPPGRLGDWIRVGYALQPTNAEARGMLRDLAQVHPGSDLSAVLGVSTMTLRAWINPARGMSGAARRVIWLHWVLILHPARVQTVFDLATWGRFRVEARRRPGARHPSRSFAQVADDWSI